MSVATIDAYESFVSVGTIDVQYELYASVGIIDVHELHVSVGTWNKGCT